MKNLLKLAFSGTLLLFAASVFNRAAAQNPSPRTGNTPQVQQLTQEEFSRKPAEIQAIILNNPHLYQVKPAAVQIAEAEFKALPAEKQKYMLDHPEQYVIVKPSDAPAGK